jgi:adenylosuccinate lyase
MPKPDYPDVLAERYASEAMVRIWDPVQKTIYERQLWLAVLKAQIDRGLDIPAEALPAYEAVLEQVDLESIKQRELVTKHDVKAKIEEFCELAGHEHIHKGMTSRDLTENVEQMQVRRSMELVRNKLVAVLVMLAERAAEYETLVIAGRSHNVPAQAITLGKRFANCGEDLLRGFDRLEALIGSYTLRGIKGPMGTSQDMLDLFEGDVDKVVRLECEVAKSLGFASTMNAVAQVYPRAMDYDVVSQLDRLAAPIANLANTIRLMAGEELATEGFKEGQVGSTAMPHKMNARTCERICGFKVLLTGYATCASVLAAQQWNEGDVSCSVVRRVILPDAFFTFDGILENFLTVLRDFGAYPAVIEVELRRYLPFLATTKILMAAVKTGIGREVAHRAIKQTAVGVAKRMRLQGQDNDLLERLADDPEFRIDVALLQEALANPLEFTGTSSDQVTRFVSEVHKLVREMPEAAAYEPADIL